MIEDTCNFNNTKVLADMFIRNIPGDYFLTNAMKSAKDFMVTANPLTTIAHYNNITPEYLAYVFGGIFSAQEMFEYMFYKAQADFIKGFRYHAPTWYASHVTADNYMLEERPWESKKYWDKFEEWLYEGDSDTTNDAYALGRMWSDTVFGN